jgi:hypothetical protein
MTTERQLDALLGAWATEQRLGSGEANALLRSIMDEPRETLAPSWWSELSAQVTSAVLLATSPPGVPTMVAA